MICQSDKALATVFYVPNNDTGKAFLKEARRYLNCKCHRIRLRGRNEKRNGRRQSIPLKDSTYFAVYIDSPPLEKIRSDNSRRLYVEVASAKDALRRLQDQRQTMGRDEEQLSSVLEALLKQFAPRKIRLE